MLETGKFVVSKLKSSEKPGRQMHLCVSGWGVGVHTHTRAGGETGEGSGGGVVMEI